MYVGLLQLQVSLGYGDLKEKEWGCGGTLISDEFVLTPKRINQNVNTDGGPFHVNLFYTPLIKLGVDKAASFQALVFANS